jgi:calcineurin-like phosphoesterase family protein
MVSADKMVYFYYKGRVVYCRHRPYDFLEEEKKYGILLHGHCHGMRKNYDTYIDCGVDAMKTYFPLRLDEILAKYID